MVGTFKIAWGVTLPQTGLEIDCSVTTRGSGNSSDDRALGLLHGIGGGAADWDRNVGHFANMGFWVFAPDLPGHGGSDPPPSDWDSSHGTALVAGILGGLQIESTSLSGHSTGGLLAAQAALERPERVDFARPGRTGRITKAGWIDVAVSHVAIVRPVDT
jgi:2-hydroxy-6-oxonona-2,4-dienedioate hydrolase